MSPFIPHRPHKGLSLSAAQRAAETLGLSLEGLTIEQVKAAFRYSIRAAHVDAGASNVEVSADRIAAVKVARDTLIEWVQAEPDDNCSLCRGSGFIRAGGFRSKRCPKCQAK